MIRFFGRGAVLAAALAGLAGCQDATLRRFDAISDTPPAHPDFTFDASPQLSITSAPPASDDPFTVKGLPERAAAAYINSMAKWSKDAASFRAALSEPIKKAAADVTDQTLVSRVLVVGVQRKASRPGDRLLVTNIELVPSGFSFAKYEVAATTHATVNIGTVSVTNQNGLTGTASVNPGGPFGALGLTASRTHGTTANRTITEQDGLSIVPEPTLISLNRSGAEGEDLIGDTLIKIALQLPHAQQTQYAIASVKLHATDAKTGAYVSGYVASSKAVLTLTRVNRLAPSDLYVCGRMTFENRRINSGARYLDEGRQTIRPIRPVTTTWHPYLIMRASENALPLWLIQTYDQQLGVDDGGRLVPLYFSDVDQANDLVRYLQTTRRKSVGKARLLERQVDAVRTPLQDFDALQVAPVTGSDPDPAAVTHPPQCDQTTGRIMPAKAS